MIIFSISLILICCCFIIKFLVSKILKNLYLYIISIDWSLEQFTRIPSIWDAQPRSRERDHKVMEMVYFTCYQINIQGWGKKGPIQRYCNNSFWMIKIIPFLQIHNKPIRVTRNTETIADHKCGCRFKSGIILADVPDRSSTQPVFACSKLTIKTL